MLIFAVGQLMYSFVDAVVESVVVLVAVVAQT